MKRVRIWSYSSRIVSKIYLSLIVAFYLKTTKNRTKKYLSQLLHYFFSYAGNLFVGAKNFSYPVCYENIGRKHNKII